MCSYHMQKQKENAMKQKNFSYFNSLHVNVDLQLDWRLVGSYKYKLQRPPDAVIRAWPQKITDPCSASAALQHRWGLLS